MLSCWPFGKQNQTWGSNWKISNLKGPKWMPQALKDQNCNLVWNFTSLSMLLVGIDNFVWASCVLRGLFWLSLMVGWEIVHFHGGGHCLSLWVQLITLCLSDGWKIVFVFFMVGSLACFTEGFYSDFEVSCVSKRAGGLTDGMVALAFCPLHFLCRLLGCSVVLQRIKNLS